MSVESHLVKKALFLVSRIRAAERHWENDGTGMQVPFHGDFSHVPPSVRSRLRWWRRELESAMVKDGILSVDHLEELDI